MRVALATLAAAGFVTTAAGAEGRGNGRILLSDADGLSTVDPDGSGRLRLPVEGSSPTFSPDGTRVAFTKSDGGPPRDLYVVNADGTGGERQIASHPEAHNSGVGIVDLEWAPDGSKIAYLLPVGADPLRIVDSRDGAPVPFRSDGRNKAMIAWSPDGSELAYSDNGGEIYAVSLATGATRQLSRLEGFDLHPAWSPDGSRIAWTHTTGPETGVWVASRDGGSPRRVGATPAGFPGEPTWSPDSSSLLFDGPVSSRPGLRNIPVVETGIWVVQADGSGQTLLRTHVLGPAWSPDGTKILIRFPYAVTTDGWEYAKPGVYVMNADGSCLTLVTSGTGIDWQPRTDPPSPPLLCVDLVVSLRASRVTGLRGANYSVSVQNQGNATATDVRIDQQFDQGVAISLGRSTRRWCSTAGQVVTCRIERMEPRDVFSAAVLARPRAAGFLESEVEVRAGERDADPATDQAAVRTRVRECWISGSDFADTLRGTRKGEHICGFASRDTIHALGGADVVDGGAHADTLDGGAGRDRLIGGRGDDRIFARDGFRDIVNCGLGRDNAVVDRFDTVLRGCERVRRGS